MIEKEFFTVRELSVKHNLSTRHIRRRIMKFNEESCSKGLIIKDKNNNWLVNQIIEYRFKAQRNRNNKYYALTIDPCYSYTTKEIDDIMKFVHNQLEKEKVEINYSIEPKSSNNQNHIHCFIKSSNKRKVIEALKLGFSKISYLEAAIFDLDGWKKYITKYNNKIKTLK